MVTTYDGTIEPRINCRFIKGKYYIKNVQCFYLREKWIRIDSKFIEIDHEFNSYIHKEDANDLQHGIIGFKNGDSEVGFYTPNPIKNISLYTILDSAPCEVNCIDASIVDKSNYIETSFGFIEKSLYSSLSNNSKYKSNLIRYNKLQYRFLSFEYNTDNAMDSYMKLFNDSEINKLKSDIELNHSYGIEYETNEGFIPEYKIYKSGLIPLRDGSLKHPDGLQPFEYATIPMSGKDALKMTKYHTEILNKFCSFAGNKESLHIHQGQSVLTKEYVVAYYKLALLIQDEMYSLFPSYVKNGGDVKNKSYCAPLYSMNQLKDSYTSNCGSSDKSLSSVDVSFMHIYYYLSGENIHSALLSKVSDIEFFKSSHPSDPKNRSKWNISKRYHWCNFISLLFSAKRTIEWRLHTPTFNFDKIKAYMLILDAVAMYVRKNTGAIIKSSSCSLKEIIMFHYGDGKLSNDLLSYIDYRKDNYTQYKFNGDKLTSNEIDQDALFEINF